MTVSVIKCSQVDIGEAVVARAPGTLEGSQLFHQGATGPCRVGSLNSRPISQVCGEVARLHSSDSNSPSIVHRTPVACLEWREPRSVAGSCNGNCSMVARTRRCGCKFARQSDIPEAGIVRF